MLLLDKPVKRASDSDEISYCHVLCGCHPTLALCGAYKPMRCGTPYMMTRGMAKCPKCKKLLCPDCEKIVRSEICPRCKD